MRRLLISFIFLFLTSSGGALSQATPTQDQPAPLTVRVEPIGPLILDAGPGAPPWSYLVPTVGPILSGALALIGVWLGTRIAAVNTRKTIEASQKGNEAALWQKANETELRDIQAKLDGFYIPFQLLSEANFQFAQDLRSRQPSDFRLLVKLFDSAWLGSLPPGDKRLVAIVCDNAEDLRKLILSKSGLVDDKILPYLSRASAHFLVLHLAHKRELGEDPARFMDYVYPRQLDGALALEVDRLRNRIEQLKTNPGGKPPPLDPLNIPPDLQLAAWKAPGGSAMKLA